MRMKLEAVNLDKRYRKSACVKNVSFSPGSGDLWASGAQRFRQKSTLMNIVTTNLRATSGEISWNGMEIHKLGKEYRKIVGCRPAAAGVIPGLTVIDFMQVCGAAAGGARG